MARSSKPADPPGGADRTSLPSISLPKGGGAIRSIGEKFGANPVTGTASMAVPIATSPGRSGFGPQIALTYDSGAGNGPFGFGWRLSVPSVTRKTEKGLPQYRDAEDSDVFVLSGAEDLVPAFAKDAAGHWVMQAGRHVRRESDRTIAGVTYTIRRYLPRIEGSFTRIERWTRRADGDVHWRSISKDNVLSVYGIDADSRISDPADRARVFSWLISETRDDRGNAVLYRYKPDDGTELNLRHAHERNRGDRDDPRRRVNRYLKRIHYGNGQSLLDNAGHRPVFLDAAAIQQQIDNAEWMFEVVLDYGDHDSLEPAPNDDRAKTNAGTLKHPWKPRPDPFSSYRSAFEIRTTRLCQRILMFHHFPAEAGIGRDCLVASTDFTYSNEVDPAGVRNPVYTFLRDVTRHGYRRKAAGDGYNSRHVPPLHFEYSKPVVQDRVEAVEGASLENLPVGIDGAAYRLADLHGEGIPGVLTEQATAWFYSRNLSPIPQRSAEGREEVKVRFGALETVAPKPHASLRSGAQLLDLAGDGQPDLVVANGPVVGFYEHDDAEGWWPFRPFVSRPTLNLNDPNLKFIDLDGDGRADLLITEDDAFVCHAALGEEGFGPARRLAQAADEESGPRLIFADGTQSIYLADLTGDGLTDVARIRNGHICYWPNLGYGRFGAKVTMDNAPWFDQPDQFDQMRIRVADIDGSGTTDIIYLHRDGVRLYFNQSGNGWSQPQTLNAFSRIDDVVDITIADLLGNGTACLVWSSSLPADDAAMRYVSLMGGTKPHLLTKVVNNLGGETRIDYAPSTKFYLLDKRDGWPWITRLPFPVHVVERVETVDYISRTRLVSRYVYHHGCFDGDEREFRGFGMVEQHDAEAFEDYVVGVRRLDGTQEQAPELNQPPVTTKTWYHTGTFLDHERILHQYRHEYYQQQHTQEPVIPTGLNLEELRECLRALKGLSLRREVYSHDNSADQDHPYTVEETTFEIRLLQPRDFQPHGVFFTVGRSAVALHYERSPADPRITQTFGLELDEYGNASKACSVVYGRSVTDASLPGEVTGDQRRRYVTYTESEYTTDIDRNQHVDAYRLRVPYTTSNYEITGIAAPAGLYDFDVIKAEIAKATPIGYEVMAVGTTPQRRLLNRSRTRFLDNALAPLPLPEWDSLGLVHETYSLAFTPAIITAHYGANVTDGDLAAAGYVHVAGDADWWRPSGTVTYPANPAAHFYLPAGAINSLDVETVVTLDRYHLLTEKHEVKQAAWSVTTAVNDYRVLTPTMVVDPNKNRGAVEHDELGMVVKTATMGKAGSVDGDTLADPTTRTEYELFNWVKHRRPNFAHMFAREQHGAGNPRWQESYSYSNGAGSVALVKVQVNRGKAVTVDANGTRVEVDSDPRWVGNGRVILNNKGQPVKQYEPYFSVTHEYEDEKVLREIGVTPVLQYDPLGRQVQTLFPNGTIARVEIRPWMQKLFDANDTVKESQWFADRGKPDPANDPEPLNEPERRAAWLSAKHAGTPGVLHSDSLGRTTYTVADYGGGKTSAVRWESDLTGRVSTLFDQFGRSVATGFAGLGGTPIVAESAEKGRRWAFQNTLGSLIRIWDANGRRFRVEYDALQRQVSAHVQEPGQAERLFTFVVYGDRAPQAEERNLLGAVHQVFDQTGVMQVPSLDFKGNPSSIDRVLATDYENTINWSALAQQADYDGVQTAAAPQLATGEVFTAQAQYDALNRPTRVTLPDGTVLVPAYNEANFLASLHAQIRGQGAFIEFLKNQDYDAKGQRQFAEFGNNVVTQYFYDPATFKLSKLLTVRSGANANTESLQSLYYCYDPTGHVTEFRDDAQQTHFFRNAVVKPEHRYEYDAIYQLIRATGRELAGSANAAVRTDADLDFNPDLPHTNNVNAVRVYRQEYAYDLAGNIKTLSHRLPTQPGAGEWTRHYRYAIDSAPGDRTNRLSASSLPGDADAGPFTGTYDYDAYGNMTRMPHLAVMEWNALDQLRRVDLGGGGLAYYVYGVSGDRLRKVIERPGNVKLEWIYLGAVVLFRRRRRNTGELRMERWTVHLSDDVGPIAQVDTKTLDEDNSDPANPLNVALIRYQYTDRLGSSTLETDEHGNLISYEEYHPYGTTAYRSSKSSVDFSLKRYRFSGKERDDETGLYYFGARYYAPWLGRWTSSDPAGFADGLNLFAYCRNNPVGRTDASGTQSGEMVGIGKPPDDILAALKTKGDDNKRKLEEWYSNNAFPDPGNPNGFVMLKPGSLHWNEEKGQYWGIFDPITEEEVVVTGKKEDKSTTGPPGNDASSGATPNSGPPSKDKQADQKEGSQPGLAPVPDAARSALQEAARPSSVSGERPTGTLHLWSGPQAKADAKAAIAKNGSGWMMGDINGSPTPEHAAGEVEFKNARAKAPGGQLSQAEFEGIWGPRSASVVGRGAFAGHPVEAHGTPAPTTIQAKYELPARAVGGGLGGGLFFGSGMFTAITGGQDRNPWVAVPLVLGGVSEATFGIMYGSAAILGSAEVMAIGVAGGTLFGGATAAIGFGVASKRSFESGDVAGGVVNGLGAVGGVLLIASLFTPVGWVALAGIALVGLAAGFNLGRWWSKR